MNSSKSYRTVSSNVCRVNRLKVLDSASFYGKESSGQQLIDYNVDSIINVLRSYGLSSNTTTVTQQAIIEGLNNIGNSRQGFSVAISSDGNTVAIGCPSNNGLVGAVLIFIRVGGTWEQQYSPIVGTGYAMESTQGMSVSLSSNGNTLAVGGPGDNNNIGATWVFVRTSSSWSQQSLTKLVGTGYFGNPRQGSSVSLSSDGNTLAIGGENDNGSIGATWVFVRSNLTWSQQGSKLVGTGSSGNPRQGSSVSLSSNGNTLAIGGPDDNGEIGASWVYFRSGVIWTQQGVKLVGTGNVTESMQGFSLTLSQDGNTLVIGAPGNDGGIGAIWVFKRSLATWNQSLGPIIGTAASGDSRQGFSVSMALSTIIVGGLGNNGSVGAFWIFNLNDDNTWEQRGFRVTGSGYAGTSLQGRSVAISTDESTIIVGGPGNNNDIGASWIFVQ